METEPNISAEWPWATLLELDLFLASLQKSHDTISIRLVLYKSRFHYAIFHFVRLH